MKQSYTNQTHQLTHALQKVTETEARIADQTASYRSEASSQARLIDLLEKRNEQSRARVEEVESEWENMVKTASEREDALNAAVEREKSRADRLEAVVEDLRATRGALDAPMAFSTNDADDNLPGPSSQANTSFSLSPAAGVAARLQKTGKSFTEVYAEYVTTQEELVKSQAERRRLEELLSQVLADLEERVCAVHNALLLFPHLPYRPPCLRSNVRTLSAPSRKQISWLINCLRRCWSAIGSSNRTLISTNELRLESN